MQIGGYGNNFFYNSNTKKTTPKQESTTLKKEEQQQVINSGMIEGTKKVLEENLNRKFTIEG